MNSDEVLFIYGEPVQRSHYYRVPMMDRQGRKVSAFVRGNGRYTDYRFKGPDREGRAKRYAEAVGGAYKIKIKKGRRVPFVQVVHHSGIAWAV